MLQSIRSTSLTRYISFARHRLTRAAMVSLLPEISPEIDQFDEDALQLCHQLDAMLLQEHYILVYLVKGFGFDIVRLPHLQNIYLTYKLSSL